MPEIKTYRGNPRAHLNEWVKHELQFFPGLQKLDKLLFTTSFSQIPNNVALLAYNPEGEILDFGSQPFGKTNAARHSNVRVDMASRLNPNRSIIFSQNEQGKSVVIQSGQLNNGVSLVAKSHLEVENTGQGPQGKVLLQSILLANENDDHVVEIKLRMDPNKKRAWYLLSNLKNEEKNSVNIHLEEQKEEGDDLIYVISANVDGKTVLLPIPTSVIPYQEFANSSTKPKKP